VTAKVVVNRAMSLDGFVSGPGHSMDWVFQHAAPEQLPEVMRQTGAMHGGSRTYDVVERDAGKPSGDAYGGLWSGPMFVLTHETPARADPRAAFLSADVDQAVGTALAAAGDKNLEVLGSDVTRQCLERGLVGEIFLPILPVLLGVGPPLLSTAGATAAVKLEPVSTARSGAVTELRYKVVRACAS
jgi:dihydrofolate reductase